MSVEANIACVAVVTLAFVISGCGDDDDDGDVGEANAQFCADLADYTDAVRAAEALDPETATTDDYEAAREDVNSARADVVESGEDLSEEQWENLESQIDELRDQLEDAPDDVAVASILEGAQQQFATVQASAATVNTAVCPTGSTTTAG